MGQLEQNTGKTIHTGAKFVRSPKDDNIALKMNCKAKMKIADVCFECNTHCVLIHKRRFERPGWEWLYVAIERRDKF